MISLSASASDWVRLPSGQYVFQTVINNNTYNYGAGNAFTNVGSSSGTNATAQGTNSSLNLTAGNQYINVSCNGNNKCEFNTTNSGGSSYDPTSQNTNIGLMIEQNQTEGNNSVTWTWANVWNQSSFTYLFSLIIANDTANRINENLKISQNISGLPNTATNDSSMNNSIQQLKGNQTADETNLTGIRGINNTWENNQFEQAFTTIGTQRAGNATATSNATALNLTTGTPTLLNISCGTDLKCWFNITPGGGTDSQTLSYDAPTDVITISGGNNIDITEVDTDTNAGTICAGTTTYLDGEGLCDDISSVYWDACADAYACGWLDTAGFNTAFHAEVPVCLASEKLTSNDGDTLTCAVDLTGGTPDFTGIQANATAINNSLNILAGNTTANFTAVYGNLTNVTSYLGGTNATLWSLINSPKITQVGSSWGINKSPTNNNTGINLTDFAEPAAYTIGSNWGANQTATAWNSGINISGLSEPAVFTIGSSWGANQTATAYNSGINLTTLAEPAFYMFGSDSNNLTSTNYLSAINLTGGSASTGITTSVSGNVITWALKAINGVITAFTNIIDARGGLNTTNFNSTGDVIFDAGTLKYLSVPNTLNGSFNINITGNLTIGTTLTPTFWDNGTYICEVRC